MVQEQTQHIFEIPQCLQMVNEALLKLRGLLKPAKNQITRAQLKDR